MRFELIRLMVTKGSRDIKEIFEEAEDEEEQKKIVDVTLYQCQNKGIGVHKKN